MKKGIGQWRRDISEYTLFNNFDFGCKFYITKKCKPNMKERKKKPTKLS